MAEEKKTANNREKNDENQSLFANLISLAHESAQSSVAHGIPRLVNFKSSFDFLFWFVVVTSGLIGFGFHASYMFKEYQSESNVATNVDLNVPQVAFPHVTVCNRLPFISAYHEQFYRGVWPQIPPECSHYESAIQAGGADTLRTLLKLIVRLEHAPQDAAAASAGRKHGDVETSWLQQRHLEALASNLTHVLWSTIRDTFGKRCLAKLFHVPTDHMLLECTVGGEKCSSLNVQVEDVWHSQFLSCKKFVVKEAVQSIESLQLMLFLNNFPGFRDSKSQSDVMPRSAFLTQDLAGAKEHLNADDWSEPGVLVFFSDPRGERLDSGELQESRLFLAPGHQADVSVWATELLQVHRKTQPCAANEKRKPWNSISEQFEARYSTQEDCQLEILAEHFRKTLNCFFNSHELLSQGPQDFIAANITQGGSCLALPRELAKLGQLFHKSSSTGAKLLQQLADQKSAQALISRLAMLNEKEHTAMKHLRNQKHRQSNLKTAKQCLPNCNQLHYQQDTQIVDWPTAAALERVSNEILYQLHNNQAQNEKDSTHSNYRRFASRSLEKLYTQVAEKRNPAYFKRNVVRLKIRFLRSASMRFEENWSQSFSGFLADIGGALGLWIGVSAVCLCEVIFLVVKAIKLTLSNDKVKRL